MANEDIECPECGKWIDLDDWYESYWHDGDINEEECPHCGEIFKVRVNFTRPTFWIEK